MSRNKLRIISLALALLMSVLLLQGCSSTEKEPDTDITPDGVSQRRLRKKANQAMSSLHPLMK